MFRYKSLQVSSCGKTYLNHYNSISYKSSSIFFNVKNLKFYLSYKKTADIVEKKTTSEIAYKKKYLDD